MRNRRRSAIEALLSFPVSVAAEAVPQAIAGDTFELASEFGEPVSLRTRPDVVTLGYGFDWFDSAERYTFRFLVDATADQLRSVHAAMVYADQENTWDDWKPRLTDMGYGRETDWSRLRWYSLQSWPPLDTPAGGDCLVQHVARHGAQLVVLDTQSKFLGGDEYQASTSAAFYRHTLLPLKRLGVAGVILDHAGNDPSKPRGSSGKRDDVDTVWQLTARTRDRITATRTHSRKRHNVDTLYLRRVGDPLRHEVETADERAEQLIDRCFEAILALQPIPGPTTSGSEVLARLKKAGKGYHKATVQEAWRRVRYQLSGTEQ